MIERALFAWVPDSWPTERERRLARAVCTLAARDLGLGDVEIRWLQLAHEAGYNPSPETRYWSEDNFHGMVRSGHPATIFLRVGLPLPQLVRTTAHEVRHLWQAASCGSWERWWSQEHRTPERRADQEADAKDYARRFARDLGW